ncbi:ATP-NAD kinase [Halorussus salilacus]|uniref:ATP-NAD kinase n=1 Tax=Halorussus salilacus TaxID=2953750 RepID=UPI00209D7926|nr:ATP-NAD kinase [Halorussus salilacus]USZ68731.1 ATP-NAD kinase [Halorussus salilacus]
MTVGVVGEGSLADRVAEVADAASEPVARGTAGEVLATDPEAVVAVGESALLALVGESVEVPVLPVGAGPGYGGVDADASGDRANALSGVRSLLAGEFDLESRAVLGVSVDGERAGRALADAMLVTTEPARISEYSIRSRGERVARVRADGVVVSTPTGSPGYGRGAGGPLLEPGTGVVGVVPIAPFAVNVDTWVLDATEAVELSVERDEGDVSLLLDDRRVRSVSVHATVEVSRDGALALARVPESRSFFER